MRIVRQLLVIIYLAATGVVLPEATGVGPALADTPTARDTGTAKAAFKAADQGQWKKGRRLAARATDPLVLKTYQWFDYTRQGTDRSFDEIAAFITDNPDWPYPNLLKRRAEEAMNGSEDPQVVLDWFSQQPPVSTDGRVQFIRVLLKQGRKDQAIAEIRDTWINNNFAKRPEKAFYRRYR
ncbi:MAG TPA: hypothetical protein ENI69_06510, partial [Rhodospirillales bacterium]|nr:hypothetical protein [Rhodospirillales bacterium]